MNDTVQVSASQSKTNAILAWLFAPITSFVWKDDADEFTKAHARESLYFGVGTIALFFVLFIVQICANIIFGILFNAVYSFAGFSLLYSCLWNIVWLAAGLISVVPRIVGMIKANNGERWEVPVINEMMKKVIKL